MSLYLAANFAKATKCTNTLYLTRYPSLSYVYEYSYMQEQVQVAQLQLPKFCNRKEHRGDSPFIIIPCREVGIFVAAVAHHDHRRKEMTGARDGAGGVIRSQKFSTPTTRRGLVRSTYTLPTSISTSTLRILTVVTFMLQLRLRRRQPQPQRIRDIDSWKESDDELQRWWRNFY